MPESSEEVVSPVFTATSVKQMLQISVLGAIVGVLIAGLAFVFETYVLSALLCQGRQGMRCVDAGHYAEIIAVIIASAVGLFGLVRLQAFRPLLVVLGAAISLWGILSYVAAMPWYGIAITCALLYAAAYALLGWIARIRVFWLVALLYVLIVVAIRLILTS